MLAQYSAVTGDELRELSPFELETGSFAAPVATNRQRDPQLDEATEMLQRAMSDLKRHDPDLIADSILAEIDPRW